MPGKLRSSASSSGKPPRRGDRAGAGDEVAGAGIIAKARPFAAGRPRRGAAASASMVGQRCDEALEARRHGGDRGLLEHHFAQPHAIGIGRRLARRRAPRQAPEVIHIMLEQARCGIGGHASRYGMLVGNGEDESRTKRRCAAQRPCRARPASCVGDVGGQSFRRFGFVQSSIVSRWARDRRRALRQGLVARIDPLPGRQESRRRADPAGRGAHAPLMQHLAPDDHRAGQSLLRLCGDRPHRRSARAGRPRRAEAASGRSLRPVPKELGEGLREIADPELRACLESLAAQIAATSGPPVAADQRRQCRFP